MNFKIYLEIFGNFNYFVPQDKEKQMYDFYMIANLRGVENKRNITQFKNVAGNKPYYEPGDFEPGELESEEKQLDYMLEEASDKLLPYLKKEFLEVILKGVAGEIKDSLFFNDPYILEYMVQQKLPAVGERFLKFLQRLVDYMEPVDNDEYAKSDRFSDREVNNITRYSKRTDIRNRKKQNQKFQKNPSGHIVANMVKEHFPEIDSFMMIAKFLFLHADWSENYGGKNWANIVDAYFKLKNSSNKNQLIVAIDHVYDLQHNTGTIFTKDSDYAKKTTVISWDGTYQIRKI